MKYLTVLLLLLAPVAQAVPSLKSLIGDWSGKRIETSDGTGVIYKVTMQGTKRPDGGVNLIEKSWSPLRYTARHVFYPNGKFTDVITLSDSVIISSASGTWKIKGGQFVLSGKQNGGRFSANITVSKTAFKLQGKTPKSNLRINTNRR